MAAASEAARGGPGAAGGGAAVPDRDVLARVREGEVFRLFMSRSGAAQERARAALAGRGARLTVGDVRPSPANAVPAPVWLEAGGGGALEKLTALSAELERRCGSRASLTPAQLSRAVAETWHGGQPSATSRPASRARAKRRARECSINQRFKFRGREDGPSNGAEGPSRGAPEDIGGLKSTHFLTPGMPVRMVRNEAGIKAWCKHSCTDEQSGKDALALEGRILNVLEIRGTRLRVSPSHGCCCLLPMQIFEYCTPDETLLHFQWHTSDSIPVPNDFAESVAALDYGLDPGAEPGARSDSVAVSLQPSSSCKVRRFRATPAVGWPGVHNRVVRQVLRAGRSLALPPDGARVRVRLHEALEATGARTRRLVGDLPREAEFALGDGDVCDALECAASRMAAGELAAFCCTDAGLLQPGGALAFEPAAGAERRPGDAASPGSGADAAPAPDPGGRGGPPRQGYRALFLLEIIGVTGFDFTTEGADPNERLQHASDRKEAGTRAFKAGRTRLALERYRRTANFLSVFFQPEPGSPPQQLLQTCWLNAAQCHLLLGSHEAARRYCDAVLQRDPENVKALFRRASACQALGGQTLQALEDLSKVVAREPRDRSAQRLLREAQQGQGRHERASREVFRRACADLLGDFDALEQRLQRARAEEDAAGAEAALEQLHGALPRLTAAQACRLQLGRLLAALEAAPPGGSEAARRLAASALAEVRGLVMAAGRG